MKKNIAIQSSNVPPRKKNSNYPEVFISRVSGREKRQLGDFYGLTSFGVNLTTLKPRAQSALSHYHTKQQEFIFILEGEVTLVTNEEETLLTAGMCAGFMPNESAHYLINHSEENVTYLEVGDRISGDEVHYPDDDLKASLDSSGLWHFTHKDGTPY